MGYIDQNLLPGERVVARGRVSGASYVGLCILLLLGILSAILLIGFVLIIVAIVEMVRLKNVELGVTNRRVIGKTGVFSTNSLDLRLAKLEGVSVSQGLIGSVFNYGSVTISGTGQSRMRFPGMADPEKLRRAFLGAAETQEASANSEMKPSTSDVSAAESARFQVQIVDRNTGEESWVEVRARDEQHAIQKATATGAIVGKCQLVGID